LSLYGAVGSYRHTGHYRVLVANYVLAGADAGR
jgi:hypothetical protein